MQLPKNKFPGHNELEISLNVLDAAGKEAIATVKYLDLIALYLDVNPVIGKKMLSRLEKSKQVSE